MRRLSLLVALAACAGDPDTVQVELSPSLISSLDGRTHVQALVAAGLTPLDGEAVQITIEYTDRNGTPHAVDPINTTTDDRGVAHAYLEGLIWDGIGLVTVTTANGIASDATFTVLDRTPPKIEILPPTTDKRVGPGLPLDVQVHVTDEIGVSEVIIDGTNGIDGTRRTVLASGTQDTTLTFRMDVAVAAPNNITLYALASDLSGNYASATAMVLTVDPTITIATPPGLMGTLLVDGTQNQIANPRALAVSAKDNQLYVVDAAGQGACSPSCVWKIDPTNGTITATPVHVGNQNLEGIAFDATADTMYVTDRQNRITRLTWDGVASAYTAATLCVDTNAQRPQDGYHLVVDATLGLVAVDGNRKNVQTVAVPCSSTTVAQDLSAQDSFDTPRGIALGPAGEIYVSDVGNDRISRVDRGNGALTIYTTNIDTPYGMEWLAGGTSAFADSLLVASQNDRIVVSTKGMTPVAVSYLRNTPIDVTVAAGTAYIATSPSANNRGRIYKVTGF